MFDKIIQRLSPPKRERTQSDEITRGIVNAVALVMIALAMLWLALQYS